MIDASQIMPLNFFLYKGVYSGEHHGMRYRIKKAGENIGKEEAGMVFLYPYRISVINSSSDKAAWGYSFVVFI